MAENINETTENSAEVQASPNDYKIIVDMIREMDEQCKMLQKSSEDFVVNNGFLPSILHDILKYSKEEIGNIDFDEMRLFLHSHKNTLTPSGPDVTTMDIEELRDLMTQIKDASLVIMAAKAEADKLKSESSEVLKEYFNYMSSDRVKKSREKRLSTMKEALALEQDASQKAKMEKMISTMESAINYDFIKSRFNMYGEKEIQNIMDGFFDDKKGSYIIQRYEQKIEKFGYKKTLYMYFLNIEENFLSEEYKPFNNLFLYIYTRMVAHSDPYDKEDKLFVQSLTGALADLTYHVFESSESEQYFVSIIRDIDKMFMNYVDEFKEKNTTYIEHPVRQELIAKHESKRRHELIDAMGRLNIRGYDKDATADELQEYYNKEVELMKAKQLESYNKSELEVDEDSNDETTDEVIEDTVPNNSDDAE